MRRANLRREAIRRLSITWGAVALVGAASIPMAIGSAHADARDGQIIAERWCATCHLVVPDQTRTSDGVPTFPEIARREDVTADGLETFLASPHPVMPDMALTRNEIRALVSYIETLK